MNCKQGDLAVVVTAKFFPEEIGKIVTCVQFKPSLGEPAWIVDPPLGKDESRNGHFFKADWVFDSCLRPIRDNDGTDETLTWAGLPNKQDKQVTA